jgi:ABC-type transport system involved in cytochrome c biogenesis permease subunit
MGKKYISMVLFFSGSMLNLSAVLWNWYCIGTPPFGNMYHVMVVLGACFLPVYLVIVVYKKMDYLARYFPVAAALPVLCALIIGRDELWQQPPALRSVWLIPHVVSYIVSYSLAAVAFILAVCKEDKYEEMSYKLLAFAFPLMSFGLFSGAIWADRVWSSYWTWGDPKETWSLITWMLYVIYFHCRKTPQMQRYTRIAHVLAFLALLTTFLLVNLLPKLSSPLHSYR